MKRLKTVIHVHTDYSVDSNASPADVLALARRQGVDVLAITDHDEIGGALEARARADGVRVIVGQEISSADGHILGLFLSESVPPRMSAERTAEAIRAQGGLVFAPHPYTILCPESLGEGAMLRLLPWLDGVEVCNAQDPLTWENRWASRFAAAHAITPYVGADVHLRGWLDVAYQFMPDFDSPETFLRAMKDAEPHPGFVGWRYIAQMGVRHVWDMFSSRRLPGYGANAPDVRRADAGPPSRAAAPGL